MIYPFMTLNDDTEIVHSEMNADGGTVKVYMETPGAELGFKLATCYLPGYRWEDIVGHSEKDIDSFEEIIRSTANLIMELSKEGGFENASGF